MKKMFPAFGLILALALSGQDRAPAAVITFDDRPAFTTPGHQYANLGAHFGIQARPAEIQPGVSNSDPPCIKRRR